MFVMCIDVTINDVWGMFNLKSEDYVTKTFAQVLQLQYPLKDKKKGRHNTGFY